MASPYSRTKYEWWQSLLGGGNTGLPALYNLFTDPGEYFTHILDPFDVTSLRGDETEELLKALSGNSELSSNEVWQNLSEVDRRNLLNETDYWESANDLSTLGGLFGDKKNFKLDKLLEDLELMNSAVEHLPTRPDMIDYVGEAALAPRIAELTAPLDELRASRQSAYRDELSGLKTQFNEARKGLLSSQYQQNAQLADTMTSQMERSRRNALEAGASAGLRLADNINIMLSTQNKQAQTSLETSNQLAQMMLNQQAASRQARNDYDSYMMQDYNARNAARAQAYDEGYKQYTAADESYIGQESDWDNAYGSNPASKYAKNAQYQKRLQSKYGGN